MVYGEIYQGKSGEFFWRIRSRNKRIVGDGAEGYTRRAGARRALFRIFADVAAGRYQLPEGKEIR